MLPVRTGGKFRHQRQGEAADDELRGVDGDEPVGIQFRALVYVACHHPAQRRIRHVVHGVDGHQHRIGDGRIGDQRGHAPPLRCGIGEDHHDRPRHGREENPWPKFSPTGVGPVGKNSHNRVGHGIPNARKKQDGGSGAGREPKDIRVKICLEQNHRHEDEVGRRIGGAVAGLFKERKFLRVRIHWYYFVTFRTTFCKSSSREELPTMISNSPGSTVNFMWRS